MSKYYLMVIFSTLFAFSVQGKLPTLQIKDALSLEISSSINPATYNYLEEGFAKAHQNKNQLILIKMNTPGGLVSTTKKILTLIGESDIPVMIWITPEGASASSAGAIIASGSHLLAMSNGTNMGAATPISVKGDIKEDDSKKKAINDLVALVQSLSETRNRNAKLFGEMVEKASSFKSKEAAQKKLIDGIVNTESEIAPFIHKKVISIKGKEYQIQTKELVFRPFKMDLGQKLLNIFANPALAYILFLIGAALIYLELQAPGGYIAGSIGVISLLLAGIGFQVLPLNFGAFGLIIVAFILFILEIYITSYGIISLTGVAALLFGSLFLFRTDDAYLELSHSVIASSISAIVLFLLFITVFFIRDSLKQKTRTFFSLVGKKALIMEEVAVDNDSFNYLVKVQGEIWKATSKTKLQIGDEKIVENQKEMLLFL